MITWTKEANKTFKDIKKTLANSNKLPLFKEEAHTLILRDAA
jgi:hypothetical protein